MKLTRVLRLVAEFLGFLMVSAGGTLSAMAVFLALPAIGLAVGGSGPVAWRPDLALGSGLSGVALLSAGIWLVRRSE